MTKEKAIKILQEKIETMDYGVICSNLGIDKDVFKMAINSLQSEEKAIDRGEWIKKPRQTCGCPDGYEPKNCKKEREKDFCNCEWAENYYVFVCKSCGYEPSGVEQDFLPNFCARCGAKNERGKI